MDDFGDSDIRIPMGMTFGFSLDNMAYFSLGLPIGMAIGQEYGASLDKKAKKRKVDS